MLETKHHGKPDFSNALLSFRPHNNAVLNLSFSSDDLLLATASGDQTSQIIDMPSQLTRCELVGHHASIKQVQFQPGGSNDIVATSSRDGSIRIWDLRCKNTSNSAMNLRVNFGASEDEPAYETPRRLSELHGTCVSLIHGAHQGPSSCSNKAPSNPDVLAKSGKAPRRVRPPPSRGDVSITALSFISASRPSFLVSGSEANAVIKLWDLRMNHAQRSKNAMPLSLTRQPETHDHHRHFGLTSIALSEDASRLYALCRDNTAYVYSTSHLFLGSCPVWDQVTVKSRRGPPKTGMGPLFGLRHPDLRASSFYVKLALRSSSIGKRELLAVGSNKSCAVVFPTNERLLAKGQRASRSEAVPKEQQSVQVRRRAAHSWDQRPCGLGELPIYQDGISLKGGHGKEVTDVTWTAEGKLVSIGDDLTCRLWRENDPEI